MSVPNSIENSPPSPTTTLHNAIREIKILKSTIKEQDQFINRLKNELERAKTATTDQININKSQARRIALLETELEKVKRSLEDVNEGFQLLLHEKTMKGDFMLNPIMQHHEANNNSRQKLIDNLKESPTNDDSTTNRNGASIKPEKKSRPKSPATDLAAELERAPAGNVNNTPFGKRVEKENDQIVDVETLLEENKSLKDSYNTIKNYLQKILNRIMEEEGFEQVISADWTKRAPSNSSQAATIFSNPHTLSKPLNTKKLEHRKTLSGPFRLPATEQQQPIRRTPRQNSSSDAAPRKRWSLWWNNNGKQQTEIKKEDPYMRPMILVQETEKAKE
ncbi:1834_t:CDS:2 [Ambispora leptoticha]|uniref:1834_t:CDS:1 n=1 Tax=Ambispora leptoticha TaxID=144679 RepID=A0A9N9FNC1_9GLOM|nr:1834_t:CDS:2 [Ambispora leptoticha]